MAKAKNLDQAMKTKPGQTAKKAVEKTAKKAVEKTAKKAEKAPKKQLPTEIKDMNKKLTACHKELQEFRARKKAGEDVRIDIAKCLKFLKENREAKKLRMKKLGL